MSAPALDINANIDAIATRRVPAPVLFGGIGAMAIGLIAFVVGLVMNPAWATGAVLVGILYVLAISQGAIMFGVVATLTWARWSRPLKRIAETIGLFMPIAWLLLVLFVVVAHGIYPWHPSSWNPGGPVALEPHSKAVLFAAKPIWLTTGFFIARQLFGVGLMVLIDLLYIRASLKPDLILAKARLGDRAPGWWSMITGSDTDVAAAARASEKSTAVWAVLLAVVYAFVMSFLAFDMIMSLSPWWYTNMFGGWFFTSSFWLSMQFLGVFTLAGLDWLGVRGWIKPKTTHDLGKVILAFTMAWAYMTFAQILPIWYTNMPEETDFLMVRLELDTWNWMSQSVAVLCFIMPFTVLLSRGIKKMRWPFVALLCCMMFGKFLEQTVLVMPSIYRDEQFPWALFFIVSIGVWIGFLGLLVTFATQLAARLPTLPVADEKLFEHPWDVHVHSLDVGEFGHDVVHHSK